MKPEQEAATLLEAASIARAEAQRLRSDLRASERLNEAATWLEEQAKRISGMSQPKSKRRFGGLLEAFGRREAKMTIVEGSTRR